MSGLRLGPAMARLLRAVVILLSALATGTTHENPSRCERQSREKPMSLQPSPAHPAPPLSQM